MGVFNSLLTRLSLLLQTSRARGQPEVKKKGPYPGPFSLILFVITGCHHYMSPEFGNVAQDLEHEILTPVCFMPYVTLPV